MRKEPETLRDAYGLYKENKYLRQDMIGRIVTEIESLQARIANVDEAAVADLDKRVMGLEVGIGNALTRAMQGRFDDDLEAKVAAAEVEHRREEKEERRRGWPKGKPRKAPDVPPAPMNEMGV